MIPVTLIGTTDGSDEFRSVHFRAQPYFADIVSSLYGVVYITCCAILDEIIVSIYYYSGHAHGLLSLEFSFNVGIESRGIRIVDDNQRPRIDIRAESIGFIDGVGLARPAVRVFVQFII